MDNNQPLTPDSINTPQQDNNTQAVPTQSPFSQPVNPAPAQPTQEQPVTSPQAPVTPQAPVQSAPLQSSQQVVEKPTATAFQQQPAQVIPSGQSFAKKEQANHWMKPIVDSRPKTQVYVPLAFGEKPGSILPVGIQGYFFYIPKGKMVEVPDIYADIIKKSINQDAEAGKDIDLAQTQNEDKLRNLAQ